jgi:predicted small metal-binding protein
MKQFGCGAVVPGCQAVFVGKDEDEILRQVAEHAQADHGITEVQPELVSAVRENITSVD